MLPSGSQVVNRYRIAAHVCTSGTGYIYRVWDSNLKRYSFCKQDLTPPFLSKSDLFERASILSGLSHPSFPRIVEHFISEGQGEFFIYDIPEIDKIKEITLGESRPLSPELCLAFFDQITDGVQYLHQQTPRIIHGDIKPEVLRVTPAGSIIFLDFGLAMVGDNLKYPPGYRFPGRSGFSAPEIYGVGKIDPQTDVYSLGALLYQLVNGAPPPETLNGGLGLDGLGVQGSTLPASAFNPNTPEYINQAIIKAMQMNKADRYESVFAMKISLKLDHSETTRSIGWQGAAVLAASAVHTPPKPARPPVTKTSGTAFYLFALLAIIGVIVLAILAIGLFVFLSKNNIRIRF